MMNSQKPSAPYGRKEHRLKLNRKYNKIRLISAVLFLFLASGILIFVFTQAGSNLNRKKREILYVWNEGKFEQAYLLSKEALKTRPIDYFLLTINGFSAHQLGLSQINNRDKLFYINESIISLRKALHLKEASKDGRVFYLLGKSYYYKGDYYSDLSIKYLEMADSLFFDARDIPEYLGLAYAALGDYRSSVEAFSRVFRTDYVPSDNLLLSIARSYMGMGENNMARGYLQRCIDTSPDSNNIMIAHSLVAGIYANAGDFDNAEKHFMTILNNSGENAEVRFQLGELFNLQGDTTRARAEWRLAVRQDPTHARARARLNI